MKMFPIMGGASIPWAMIAPHARQAETNHGGQTLERLAERGGLSAYEAIFVIESRRHRLSTMVRSEVDGAPAKLSEMFNAWLASPGGELEQLRTRLEKAERKARAGRELYRNICHVIVRGEFYPPQAVEDVLNAYNEAVGE